MAEQNHQEIKQVNSKSVCGGYKMGPEAGNEMTFPYFDSRDIRMMRNSKTVDLLRPKAEG